MVGKRPVVVGLSGGVDSALAAWLMKQEGHDVIGVFLHQWDAPEAVARRCCSRADGFDARALADELDIPFIVLDARESFRTQVIEPFIQGYLGGETPNPCIVCNERVKLQSLAAKADELGAETLVTGHYARLLHDAAHRRVRLFRGVDLGKDQSYFLYRVPQEILRRLRLPLGNMTKDKVRWLAREASLSVATKPDSQQLCFLGTTGVGGFIERHLSGPKGDSGEIIGPDGKVLGHHGGTYRFTVGQRRGLGVFHREPLYVSSIDPTTQKVFVVPKEGLFCRKFSIGRSRWIGDPPKEGSILKAQIRAHHRPLDGKLVEFCAGEWWIELLEPEFAVTLGQSCVLYDGDEVVGGGEIERVVWENPASKEGPTLLEEPLKA